MMWANTTEKNILSLDYRPVREHVLVVVTVDSLMPMTGCFIVNEPEIRVQGRVSSVIYKAVVS